VSLRRWVRITPDLSTTPRMKKLREEEKKKQIIFNYEIRGVKGLAARRVEVGGLGGKTLSGIGNRAHKSIADQREHSWQGRKKITTNG